MIQLNKSPDLFIIYYLYLSVSTVLPCIIIIIINYLAAVRAVPVSKYEGGLLFTCVSFFIIPSVVTSVSKYDGGLLLFTCVGITGLPATLCIGQQGRMRGTIYHDSHQIYQIYFIILSTAGHGGGCVTVMPRKEDCTRSTRKKSPL